jgi:two-component system, NarL family, sensor histidine kinase UhpB
MVYDDLVLDKEVNPYHYCDNEDLPLRILILEDMELDAELVQLELRKLELDKDIRHVKTRSEFSAAFEDFMPHLVVSDYSLPQYTGMEALKYARELVPYIPFIICTGRTKEETAVDCIKAGADDYVLKDSMGRLTSAILIALENKKNLIEKERASHELAKSEENFRALAKNAPDNIYKIDRHGIILYINRDLDGIKRGEIIGTTIYNYVSEPNHAKLQEAIHLAWDTGSKQTIEIEGTAEPLSDWYYCRMGPVLKDGQVSALVLIPSNITEKKLAELELQSANERLHHLTQHLETVRDEEKSRISMEIHDQLGQELTGNKLGLYWIQQHFKQNGLEGADLNAIQDKLEYLIDLTTQTIQTVRRIAHELRPVVLDNIGLIPALEWHIDNYNENYQTKAHLTIRVGSLTFNNDLATALYRITQETLTNINRHAQAKNAYINFYKTDTNLVLEIKDDGVGIVLRAWDFLV